MTELKVYGDKSSTSSAVAFSPTGLYILSLQSSRRGLHYFRLSSVADTFSLEAQEAEENFDLALIGALEIDVIPQLGDLRIPDTLVTQLAKVLRHGSRLHDLDTVSDEEPSVDGSRPSQHQKSQESHDFETVDMGQYGVGSTVSGSSLPRERFSYWCFDLLFLICSNTAKGISNHSHGLPPLTLFNVSRSRIFSKACCSLKLTFTVESLSDLYGQIRR